MGIWRDRFGELSESQIKFYSFYSDGEEVLDTHTGDPGILDLVTDGVGRYAWALQEKLKGTLPVLGYIGGGRYGGWGKNAEDYYDKPTYLATKKKKPLVSILANKITLTELKTIPFFNKDFDSALFSETGGSNYAQIHRDKLLAEAFPALSLSVGGKAGDEMDDFIRGRAEAFDMQSQFQNGWPQERGKDKSWRHSDLRKVSYLYIYKIFEKMVNPTE